jgi:CheY-like chemotaxis protein
MKVLLVDDDAEVRLLMERMLRRAGVRQATCVDGGEAALEQLRSAAIPDLVILDQNMPGMDGIQTLALIREIHPDLPVLIASGQPGVQDWPCFNAAHVTVISKPFSMDEILEKLARFSSKASSIPK